MTLKWEICLYIYISCYITICFAHENDYLNTQRNMELLSEVPKTIRMPGFGSIFFPRSSETNDGNHEENDDVFKTIEMTLSDMSDARLKLKDEGKKNADYEENDEPPLTDLANCLNDFTLFMQSIQNNQSWALQMLDSYGLPFGGLLVGDSKFYGTYDECLQVQAVVPDSGNFSGKYCLASINPYKNNTSLSGFQLTVGMCVPDSCTGPEASFIVNELIRQYKLQYTALLTCQDREHPLDDKAIVAIVVCAIFAFLIALGTAYDVVFHQILKDDTESKLLNAARNGAMSKVRSTSEIQRPSDEKSPLLTSTSSVADSQSVDLRPIYDEEEPSLISKLLMSFSAYTNGAKILNTKQSTGSLTAVHGIRFLSMSWVILGHAYMEILQDSAGTALYLQKAVKRWTFHAIINALVSVDSFFALSGLLVTYLTLKELKKSKGDGRFWAGFWGKFYFHRFWRLTPVYMLCLMIYVCLFHYFADGPLWFEQYFTKDACSDTWWTNLLYVNNLVKKDEMCFGWSWYLANDMQFYIISPLIILPLFFFPVAGVLVWLGFLIATLTSAGVITKQDKIQPGLFYAVDQPMTGNFSDYYVTPYCRMGSYLAGMAAGYFLYRTNGTYKLNKFYALIGWIIAASSALAVLYGPYESANGSPMSLDVAALYNAVHRTVWGAAVAWVVWACATGNGGYVNTLLSWSGFVPLSRLSYAAYLIHLPVEIMYANSLRKVTHMDDINMTYMFLGMLTLSYLVAFVVSVCFEVPMMGLEKILLRRERKS